MVVSERNMKRKVELEDITNTNTHYNKKKKQYKLQQRSPSPVNVLSDETKQSSKSTCLSPKKQLKYKTVTFENNALLTPKEETYDDLIDIHEESEKGSSIFHQIHSPSSISLDENISLDTEESNSELNTNPDYLALTSALRLLNNRKSRIEQEIRQLSNLYKCYSKLPVKQTKSDKQIVEHHEIKILDDCKTKSDHDYTNVDYNIQYNEITDFFIKLVNNELQLPKQHRILKAPIINWSKYNLSQAANNLKGNINDKPLFKTLNLFDK